MHNVFIFQMVLFLNTWGRSHSNSFGSGGTSESMSAVVYVPIFLAQPAPYWVVKTPVIGGQPIPD